MGNEMVITDQECLDYARDRVWLAELAKDDRELRDHLLRLAREWMASAKQGENVPKLISEAVQ
jgi:hypothetical protein